MYWSIFFRINSSHALQTNIHQSTPSVKKYYTPYIQGSSMVWLFRIFIISIVHIVIISQKQWDQTFYEVEFQFFFAWYFFTLCSLHISLKVKYCLVILQVTSILFELLLQEKDKILLKSALFCFIHNPLPHLADVDCNFNRIESPLCMASWWGNIVLTQHHFINT